MASVRLRADQIARLRRERKEAYMPPAATIRYAMRRWKRGDFTIGAKPKRHRGGEQLQIFPLWKKPDGVEDWQLRAILDCHWAIPDEILLRECRAERERLDREIAAMLKSQPPYFVEKEEQQE